MSIKNKSTKSSPKYRDVQQYKRKIDKSLTAKVMVEDENKPESLNKPANTLDPASVDKQPDESAKKPVVQDVPWSDWIWDDGPGRWYKVRLTADKTWEYQCTEPSAPVLSPDPNPQFAAAASFEYPVQDSKVMFTSEVVYQVPDSRGGYRLAVRQDEQFWAVEKASTLTKAKEGAAKVETVMDKKEGSDEKKTRTAVADDCQKPSADEKLEEKPTIASVEPKQVAEASRSKNAIGVGRVSEWMVEVNAAVQEAEKCHAPDPAKKQVSEKEKKEKYSSKLKSKKVYIESDEEDEPRRRGRAKERRT